LECAEAAKTALAFTSRPLWRLRHNTGSIRLSPRDGFNGCFELSLVIGLYCHHRRAKLVSRNLTPASRRQDHTTSPSADGAFVSEPSASIASRAQRP
jgi:hypothetical protein